MKKLKIIKLKILKCNNKDCWYFNKVGKSFYFFHKIFEDDDEYKSIYVATAPTDHYAYIDDTNYKSYIRKKKLKKLKKDMTQFDANKNILTVAMTITDQDDADQYLAAYISYIQNDIDNDPTRINDNAEKIAKSNLGYFAGYYNNETRERIERLFLAEHPFFGSVKNNISPEEAFRMGQNMAIKHSRNIKIDKINKSQ